MRNCGVELVVYTFLSNSDSVVSNVVLLCVVSWLVEGKLITESRAWFPFRWSFQTRFDAHSRAISQGSVGLIIQQPEQDDRTTLASISMQFVFRANPDGWTAALGSLWFLGTIKPSGWGRVRNKYHITRPKVLWFAVFFWIAGLKTIVGSAIWPGTYMWLCDQ